MRNLYIYIAKKRMAEMILRGEIPDGSTVTVSTDKSGLVFRV